MYVVDNSDVDDSQRESFEVTEKTQGYSSAFISHIVTDNVSLKS